MHKSSNRTEISNFIFKKYRSFAILVLLAATFFSFHSLAIAQYGVPDTKDGYAATSENNDFTDDSGRKFRTVTSTGVGVNVSEAAQNAAQNALSQVVGTFIQSSSSLDKKIKIENGIKNETKNIRVDIKEYSQGYVQSFSIIKIDKFSDIFQVTAKSTIRIDDFKAYILRLAEGQREINGGLFAQVSTLKSQQANLQGLFSEKILAVINGQVSIFNIGEPNSVESLSPNFINENYLIRNFINENRQKMLIYFPVRMEIDPDFLTNMQNTFESTALGRHRLNSESTDYVSMGKFRQQIYDNNGIGIIIHNEKNGSSGKIMNGYSFPSNSLKNNMPWMNDCEASFIRNEINFPSLEIKLFDFEEKVVFFSVLEANANIDSSQNQVVLPISTDMRINNEAYYNPPWSLFRCTGMDSHVPPIIRTSTKFILIMALESDTMQNVKSIKLKLTQ
jgi:hypothetical protein